MHSRRAPNRWVGELQKYDPQNALVYLTVANKINFDLFTTRRIPIRGLKDEPLEWQNAMAAAFQSPKFDNYCSQLKALEHQVRLRYSFDDPSGLVCYGVGGLNGGTANYAASVLEAGEALEARGERKAARKKYLAVARFGQMVDLPHGSLMNREVQKAYKHLEILSENEGNLEQAELYAYLVNQTDRAEKDKKTAWGKMMRARDVTRWNALLARTSAVSLLFSAALLLVCFVVVIVRGRSLRLGSLGPGRLTATLGVCGSVGLLFSSAILYATYKPYGEVFQRFIHTGDETEMPDFTNFISHAGIPFPNDEVFWLAVIVLCVMALLVVFTRSLIRYLRATASA